MQRGLNARFWRGVEMLHLGIAGDASAQRFHGDILHLQVAASELICSLQFPHLDATAGGGSRKHFARKTAVNGDVPQQRLGPYRLIVQLAVERNITCGRGCRRHRGEILGVNLNLVVAVGDRIGVVRNLGMESYRGRPELQNRGVQVEALRRSAEFQVQIVRERCVLRIAQVTVVVGEIALIALGKRCETNVGSEIVQIGFEWSLPVVVVDLAIGELRMFHSEIEHAGVAATLAGRGRRKIVLAFPTDLEMNNGMIDQKFTQSDLAMKRRQNLYANRELVGVQERRLPWALRAAQQ